MTAPLVTLNGVPVWPEWLDRDGQRALLAQVRAVLAEAPLSAPTTPRGRPMSVRMSAAGRFGWWSDRAGYRYIEHHPLTGRPWPAIPPLALAVWRALAPQARAPECCLINHYAPTARMGLHQDRDEADFSQPVVSISLGDSALFRVGGTTRDAPTRSLRLDSGAVCMLAGPARLAFHGIDRIHGGSSTLLAEGGRINLTLRVVT